jgi:mRNA interferase RelE/StbE
LAYSVVFARRARKTLQRLDRQTAKRIVKVVESLVEQPRPPGAHQLKGSFEWRIRVGYYRVIYEIHDDRLFVLVVKVGHRREIYRKT